MGELFLSPNYNIRPADMPVDMLIMHYTGMASGEAALARLCDPTAKVSAHYLVDQNGAIHKLVAEKNRAWHAGASCWAGREDINSRSIGIEIVNPGHEFGYQNFPVSQMVAVVELAQDIVTRHKIKPPQVLGHSDVAPLRRRDPGEHFDWALLASASVGMWVEPAPIKASANDEIDAAIIQRLLGAYGYQIPTTGYFDDETRAVIRAFQRHFRPARIDGMADASTLSTLEVLLSAARPFGVSTA
ncbi:MAG: N-acetylmuramoyl-L-alanine amidase [Parvularculales bacterium]